MLSLEGGLAPLILRRLVDHMVPEGDQVSSRGQRPRIARDKRCDPEGVKDIRPLQGRVALSPAPVGVAHGY